MKDEDPSRDGLGGILGGTPGDLQAAEREEGDAKEKVKVAREATLRKCG